MQIRPEHIKWAGYTVLTLLLLALLFYGFRAIRKLFSWGQDAEEDVFPDVKWKPTPYTPDGGALRPGFNPDSYVSELKDVLETSLFDASPRCRAYRRLVEETNDNEFIEVLNTFYQRLKKTLRQAMNDTWQSGCTIFGTQWDERIYDRMESLNVVA